MQGERTDGKTTPNAITSRRYQEVFEKKKLAKRRTEEEKEERKRKHIEKKRKEAKTSVCFDHRETKTGFDSSCSTCHKTITSESGRDFKLR